MLLLLIMDAHLRVQMKQQSPREQRLNRGQRCTGLAQWGKAKQRERHLFYLYIFIYTFWSYALDMAVYRVAGDASTTTALGTVTVEVNSGAVKKIKNGNVAKFKFPGSESLMIEFDIEVQRQIISFGLDDSSPNGMLPNVHGRQYGEAPDHWRRDVISLAYSMLMAKLIIPLPGIENYQERPLRRS